MGCVGVAGTVPAAGSEGACTCWEVASGDGGGGGALRRAAWGVGGRARGRALGKAPVGVGGGEGGVTCLLLLKGIETGQSDGTQFSLKHKARAHAY